MEHLCSHDGDGQIKLLPGNDRTADMTAFLLPGTRCAPIESAIEATLSILRPHRSACTDRSWRSDGESAEAAARANRIGCLIECCTSSVAEGIKLLIPCSAGCCSCCGPEGRFIPLNDRRATVSRVTISSSLHRGIQRSPSVARSFESTDSARRTQ